jgi:hypothetical protein
MLRVGLIRGARSHPGAAVKGVRRVRGPALLLGLLAVASLVGCAASPTPAPSPAAMSVLATPAPVISPVPSPSPSPTQFLLPGRPILYFGGETVQDTRQFVTRGVYVNGQPWVPGLPASGAAWSPAGTRLAFVDAARPEILYVLIRTGASPPVYGVGEAERLVPWPAWAPDGIRTAVLIRRDGDPSPPASLAVIAIPAAQLLSRYDLPAETIRLPKRTKPLNAFHWSADGQQILLAWENAVVLDTRNGKITPITPDFAVAEWAGSGDAVLYFTVEGAILGGFCRQALDGSPAVELASREQVAALGLRLMKDSYGLMHLSPDRKRLAMAFGVEQPGVSAVRIYDVATCTPGITQPCPDPAAPAGTYSTAGDIAALEWAPDGAALAAIAVLPEGAALQALDLTTGLWRSPLPGAILQADELPVLGYIRTLSWGGG